jgi:four helix bundle protein
MIKEKSPGLCNTHRENCTSTLPNRKKEYVLSKQLLRSGTAIGALVKEAEHAQSKPDFLNKMNLALKEANETLYWLIQMKETEYLKEEEFKSVYTDAEELVKMLASIVKTTKIKLNK